MFATRHLEQKRLEILRGAAAAFRRRGFDGAGMREIGASLGMTQGNLYYYFKNKQEILYFCQDYSLRSLLRRARVIERLPLSADRKLFLLIVEHMRLTLDELGASAAHIDFAALEDDRYREVVRKRDRYERALRRILRDGADAGIFAPCDEKLIAFAILGAMNWTIRWFRPEGPRPIEDVAREFARFLVRGLLIHPDRFQEPRGVRLETR